MPSGLWSPFLLLVQGAWLLAPGLVVAAELARRDLIARYLVVPVAGVAGAVLSYGAVWIYLANRTAGEAYSYLTAVVALACVGLLAARRADRLVLRAADVAGPLILVYVVALFLSTASLACSLNPSVGGLGQACHLTGLTGDNVLPQFFADNVLRRHPRTVVWEWQGSARPPLQSGAVLLQHPITGTATWHTVGYQSLSVLLQVLCIPAVWALLRMLRLSGHRLAVVLTMIVFTGFFVYNSVFVWPKLLAAAMVLTAFALLFSGVPSRLMWAVAGVAAGAGMVAHAGVAFTLLPMGLLLLLPRHRPSWGHLGLTALGGLLMLAPWTAYQKLVDPPGDQLLKWHFAGQWQPAGETKRSAFTELVVDRYTSHTFGEIVDNKLYNYRVLLGQRFDDIPLAGGGFDGFLRTEEMFFLLFGLGLFNLALVLLLVPALRRRLPQVMDVSRLKTMALVAGINLAIWPLLLFGPGNPGTSPLIFQGSYAMMLLLFIVLGAILTVLPRPVTYALAAANVAYASTVWFVLVWVGNATFWSYLAVSIAGWAAVLLCLWRIARWLDADAARPVATTGQAGPERHLDEAGEGHVPSTS